MAERKKRIPTTPNTGNEDVPPGATGAASSRPDRQTNSPADGGDRHATGTDPDVGLVPPLEGEDTDEAQSYGGPAGGAVGGTPAGKRARGGHTGHGLRPGRAHRGDSTVGADPDQPTE